MSTLTADPPAPAQSPPAEAPPPASAPQAQASAPTATCARCGAALAPGQDWCLQCGAGAPGSLAGSTHNWRPTGIVAALVALLVAGAGVAAYAAWGKRSHSAAPRAGALASSTTAAAPGLGATSVPPSSSVRPGIATPANPALGLGGLAKPPRIPLRTVTPKLTPLPPSATKPANTGTTTPTTTTTTPATTGGSTTSELPPAIELDTNAASTYDPYAYPASNFGDPSRAIDGDTSTGWTAQVDPAVAPKMAEGLSIDLRSARALADVKLYTSTSGMTVQVYGANGHALPESITDKAWVPVSRSLVVKKKSTTIKLRDSARAFRFFVLWISRAPQSSVGTPAAPGHVTVDELELFPPK